MATKLQIVKAKEIVHPLRALWYGDSGTGKTYLAMQADMVEGMTPALLCSCDRGTATARRTDIDVVMIDTPGDMAMVMRELKKGLPHKTIIIDGMSQFYDALVLANAGGGIPEIRDWLKTSFDVKKLIRSIVRAGRNIFVTCLAQRLTEEASGLLYTAPLVAGKMAFRMPEAFDIVGNTQVVSKAAGRVAYQVQVVPYRRIIAKDRDSTLGAPTVDVTWQLGSGPSPMQALWDSWTSKTPGTARMLDSGTVEVDEDDVMLYEAGDQTMLKGGDV